MRTKFPGIFVFLVLVPLVALAGARTTRSDSNQIVGSEGLRKVHGISEVVVVWDGPADRVKGFESMMKEKLVKLELHGIKGAPTMRFRVVPRNIEVKEEFDAYVLEVMDGAKKIWGIYMSHSGRSVLKSDKVVEGLLEEFEAHFWFSRRQRTSIGIAPLSKKKDLYRVKKGVKVYERADSSSNSTPVPPAELARSMKIKWTSKGIDSKKYFFVEYLAQGQYLKGYVPVEFVEETAGDSK